MAGIAAGATFVGLVTGILTLREQLTSNDDGTPTIPAPRGSLTPATAGQLVANVQLGQYEDLLGPPLAQVRLQNDEWLVTTWQTVDIQVQAYSDQNHQVVAYTLTSLSPTFTPIVADLAGGVRLRSSTFNEVNDTPSGVEGAYPLNGRFYYLEYYQGGGANGYKSHILAASYAANADDKATLMVDLQCLPFSVFEWKLGCRPDQLEPLREALHVTSVTTGDSSALEALSRDGALFFPDPF